MLCYTLVLVNACGISFGIFVLDMSMILQGGEAEKVGEICIC